MILEKSESAVARFQRHCSKRYYIHSVWSLKDAKMEMGKHLSKPLINLVENVGFRESQKVQFRVSRDFAQNVTI